MAVGPILFMRRLVGVAVQPPERYQITSPIKGDLVVEGPRPWVDVRAKGARGDGVTDDTAAFAAALAAAGSSHEVFVPAGTYLAQVGLQLKSRIRGAGREYTTIKAPNGLNGSVVVGSGSSGGALRDLTVNGNSANQTSGHGIFFTNMTDFDIIDVDVTDAKQNGILFQNGGGRLRIHGGWVHHNKNHGIVVQASPIVDTVLIEWAWISDNGTLGTDHQNVRVDQTPSVRIVDCVIWQATGANVLFYATAHSALIGSYILSAQKWNVRLGGHAGAHPQDIQIESNLFTSPSIEGASLYEHIELGGHALAGAVDAASQVDRIVIVGNSFKQGAGPAVKGTIIEEAGSTDTIVAFNTIEGTAKTITLNGTGSVMFGNRGYITENNVLSGTFAIDSTGIKTVTIAHGLSYTPSVEHCQLTVIEVTNVDNWAYNLLKIDSVDATNVTAKVNVSTASATGGATAKLALRAQRH